MAKVAPIPKSIFAPPPSPSVGTDRLRRALVAPPKENLRKYGFQTASMIENAKTASVPLPPRGPSAAPLEKSITQRKQIGNKPYYKGQQPYVHSATGQAIYRDPGDKVPSVETLTGQTYFDPVLAPAANPRIAALSAVLGGVTGLPAIVGAVRKGNALSAGAQAAALFTPVGKLQEVTGAIRAGEEIGGIVKAARAAGHIKGAGRDAFTIAIREAAPNKAVADAALRRADALVHESISKLPVVERKAAAQELYDQLRQTVPSRHIPDFERVVPPELGQKNLRSVMKPENVSPPKNVALPSLHPDSASAYAPAGHQVLGDITPEAWWARTQHAVGNDPAVGLKLANWYSEIGPMITHFFGEDSLPILRGFAVSQANASPAGGLMNVLRVRDKLLRGETISEKEISTVVKSIEAAYKGEPITKGLQAKLHDFSDALEGKSTRTWTADDIRGGAPTPTDIHALRDLGWIDPKILRVLQERHGLPVSHLRLEVMQKELARLRKTGTLTEAERKTQVAAQQKRIANFKKEQGTNIAEHRRSGLVLDSGGVAGAKQYNHAVAKYQAITDHLNEIKAWGKSDWTPAEVQALGWSAIQRFHGTVPEDAQFMIDRNTTSIQFEVLNSKTGIGDGLSPAQQYKVTKDVVDAILPKLLAQENVIARGEISYGLGGLGDRISPTAYIKVLASPEQVDRTVARLANIFQQYDINGVRVGVSISKRPGAGVGKAALEFRGREFGNPKKVEAFWTALRDRMPENLKKHFDGFSAFTHEDGTPGIRVITDAPPQSKAIAEKWAHQFNTFVVDAMRDAGVSEAKYNPVNVEIRNAVGAKARTRAAARVGARGVGDPLAAEAQSHLADAVARYTGPAERLTSDRAALRPDVLRHDPHGLEQGIPVHFPPERPRPPVAEGVLGVSQTGRGTEAATRTPAEQVAASLHGAASLKGKESALGREARILKMKRGQAMYDLAGGGVGGYYAKMAELKGALPKLNFGAFKEFDQAGVEALIRAIEDHPDLRFWEKIRAQTALMDAIGGRVPAPAEIKLLRRVFGEEVTANIKKAVPITKKMHASRMVGELWNLPRAFRSTLDMSAPLRQGLVAFSLHPRLTFQSFKRMFRIAGSENAYAQTMDEIVNSPYYEDMVKAGVEFTDLDAKLSAREEAWYSNMGERIPKAGGLMRGSQRAYTGFLNKARADIFTHLWEEAQNGALQQAIEKGAAKGKTETQVTNEVLKGLGDVVNTMTGRGKVYKSAAQAMPFLNNFLFSPRLLASRVNLISPFYYASLPPVARREAVKALGSTIAVVGTVLTMASLAGAKVVRDPHNADFAKLRFGNTRMDLLGGHAQIIRLLAQMISGYSVSSTTGKRQSLTAGGFGQPTRWSTLVRFAQSKASPSAAAMIDALSNMTDMVGQPVSWRKEVAQLALPLLYQDVYDTYHATGSVPATAGILGAGFFGLGTQTYKGKPAAPPPGSWSIPSSAPTSDWKLP